MLPGTIKKAGFPTKEVEEALAAPILNGHSDTVTNELETKCQMHCAHDGTAGLCDSESEHMGTVPGSHSCASVQRIAIEVGPANDVDHKPVSASKAKKNISLPDTHTDVPILEHNTEGSKESTLYSPSKCSIPNGDVAPNPCQEDCGAVHKGSGHQAHLVCYGLGRFATCHIARYQLAFFLALRDHFQACILAFCSWIIANADTACGKLWACLVKVNFLPSHTDLWTPLPYVWPSFQRSGNRHSGWAGLYCYRFQWGKFSVNAWQGSPAHSSKSRWFTWSLRTFCSFTGGQETNPRQDPVFHAALWHTPLQQSAVGKLEFRLPVLP